ncbi:hypothetical protein COV58_00230 [Candidatus Roizmanbacteria bacterium CG11_big_fil_rev_8_21_14_0_20_36_8]|uniref:Uncharacterized protein n=1 Tax=Candidatus Roizmanbacteria bacterium CG11_big_fil_rev_8_21_14_0_20_36_8 TaxID=1974856 RepID=A0A2M6IV69_9BACT|nr:MAG: hypothetical protein COV58_00230 [Candidatus Roizmanbacteria bacterium CG11_big_fil_rev_8_21_14_0_20_36_8]
MNAAQRKSKKHKDTHKLLTPIDTGAPIGVSLSELIGMNNVPILVAINQHKASVRTDYIAKRILNSPVESDRVRRSYAEIIVDAKECNGGDEEETLAKIAMDIAVQMFSLTCKIYDPIIVEQFVALMTPELRQLFFDQNAIHDMVKARYRIIKALNPIDSNDFIAIDQISNILHAAAYDTFNEPYF